MDILSAMRDPKLFGPWFKNDTWEPWMTFLKALFGLPLTKEEREVFAKFTGRTTYPANAAKECWVIAGRRAGKSLMAAFVATYLSTFVTWSKYLSPGELAVVMILACDRRQAAVIMRYINAFFDSVPLLSALVVNRTKESLQLSNGVSIEVHTNSYRSVRGFSCAAVIADEVAFWRSDKSQNPDTEVLNALRPSLASLPGSMLLCISSPYARRGECWEAYQRYYGKNDAPVLVWRSATRDMNPNVSQAIIDEAVERDEPAARAEWLAEFRSDVELFISRESLQAAVIPHRVELPYSKQFEYFGFCDASGGQVDSMTMGIAHEENGKAVLDLVREVKAPFNPDSVTNTFAMQLQSYRIHSVHGDRYAGAWPQERFRHHGVEYKTSELTKSELYKLFLIETNSGHVELLDHSRMLNQFLGLERRTGSGGRESIDHSPGSHDDVCNSAAGALYLASGAGGVRGGPAKLVGT